MDAKAPARPSAWKERPHTNEVTVTHSHKPFTSKDLYCIMCWRGLVQHRTTRETVTSYSRMGREGYTIFMMVYSIESIWWFESIKGSRHAKQPQECNVLAVVVVVVTRYSTVLLWVAYLSETETEDQRTHTGLFVLVPVRYRTLNRIVHYYVSDTIPYARTHNPSFYRISLYLVGLNSRTNNRNVCPRTILSYVVSTTYRNQVAFFSQS